MKRGKRKTDKQTVQLALFEEEQPAQPEQQEMQAEPAPPKKRPRKEKPPKPPAPEKTPVLEEQEASPAPAPLPVEEKSLFQEPADSKSTDEQEDERIAKYKKVQEARLEALRRARGKK